MGTVIARVTIRLRVPDPILASHIGWFLIHSCYCYHSQLHVREVLVLSLHCGRRFHLEKDVMFTFNGWKINVGYFCCNQTSILHCGPWATKHIYFVYTNEIEFYKIVV